MSQNFVVPGPGKVTMTFTPSDGGKEQSYDLFNFKVRLEAMNVHLPLPDAWTCREIRVAFKHLKLSFKFMSLSALERVIKYMLP